MDDKKFAILIDGDNINNKYIKIIIDEVAKEGTITLNEFMEIGLLQIYPLGKKFYWSSQ